MFHLIQVGLGSGGMAVLDMVLKDQRISKCTLIEPDVFKQHNLQRHLFGIDALGFSKAKKASDWVKNRRPDLDLQVFSSTLQECSKEQVFQPDSNEIPIGICAVDNEPAKYHWCSWMREQNVFWTLGEVLSGGIGGFVHVFSPSGPCYGCVCSHLKREGPMDGPEEKSDYSQPTSENPKMRISATFSSIMHIASIHALKTLEMLDGNKDPHSLLMPMKKLEGVFEKPWSAICLQIPKNLDCYFCKQNDASSLDIDGELARKIRELSGGI
jgi:hypothetical protein